MGMMDWPTTTWLVITYYSIAMSIFFLIITVVTGAGRETLRRFINKLKFRSGKWANTLFISKSGNIMECFKKVSKEGTFLINEKSYVRNPSLQFQYKGIPSMVHIEDFPDPVNHFKDKQADELSCAEMDTVMMSQTNFDLKQWINKIITSYGMVALIVALVVVGAFAAMAYFGYMNYQMLRDGSYSAIKAASMFLLIPKNWLKNE